MSGRLPQQQSAGTTLTTDERVSTKGSRRFVIDFGPSAQRKDHALDALEEWLANGSKYAGAILIKTPFQDDDTNGSYVTAIELSVRVHTMSELPEEGEPGSYLWRGTIVGATKPERLTLSDSSREIVCRRVTSALAYALGEGGRDVVLAQLQLDYGFGFSEVTDYPGRFIELLNEILHSGARFVEERIVQELSLENPDLRGSTSFKEAVTRLVRSDTSSSTLARVTG